MSKYFYYKRPTKTMRGKQTSVSRLTMQNYLGKKLKSHELVHHINGDTSDNRIENLMVVTRAEHKKIHNEIGKDTRLKQIFFFNDEKLKKQYNKYKSSYIVSKFYGCHPITIERALKKMLNLKSIWDYRISLKRKEKQNG
jgi:hypothetical protein